MDEALRTSTIVPFRGTVTVSFSDAIIASSKDAKVLSTPGKEAVFFLPFEDIYFDFLTLTRETRPRGSGSAAYWRVNAVGEAADNFMWSYEAADGAEHLLLERHAAFDPTKARIEAVPA
jgi:uncharacterized protein (DUF427 family)